MKEKKYIDRLYQEKFRDFEATPRDLVWENIASRLHEKDKKPVITPFWSRIAGIAAIFALLLSIGEWMLPVTSTPAVVNEDTKKSSIPNLFERTLQIADRSNLKSLLSGDKKESEVVIPTEEKVSSKENASSKITSLETGVPKKISSSRASFEAEEIAATLEEAPPLKDLNKKSLFEEVNKKEEVVVAQTSKERFEVSTHAAPIYYGNFGKGNFLDSRFNNNNSEGEITYSYGINLAYALSDRVKIRSGVNKVNMSYNTNGITYQAVAGPVPVSGISIDSRSSDPRVSGELGTSKPIASNNRPGIGAVRPGLLNQKMGFIEIPVELEYNIIDSKFELNVIGGASTLFLDENRISVNSGNSFAKGRANNLNGVSFSTNLGLGLDYNLSNKFKLNFEPMLKYQVNTFSTTSTDNQPYYLGIYSGFSYKF